MKSKKIVALGLAATMSMAMGLTAFAAAGDATDSFWTTYPNLTNYDTDYTYVLEPSSDDQERELMVQAMSSDWMTSSLFSSSAYASAISWDTVSGSVSGVTATASGYEKVTDATYAAKTTATVDASVTKGVAVVEATNPVGNYMDFTIVVNPTQKIESQGNVNVKVYDGTAVKADGSLTAADPLYNATVTALTDKVTSDINYPSAMDALKSLAGDSCTVVEQYGTNVVYTLNGVSNVDFSGWQYRVYDANGALVPISEKIGAETYEAKDGETVVWAYGSYYDTLFPASIAAN